MRCEKNGSVKPFFQNCKTICPLRIFTGSIFSMFGIFVRISSSTRLNVFGLSRYIYCATLLRLLPVRSRYCAGAADCICRAASGVK